MNVEKTKEIQLLYGKKAYVLKVDHCDACGERVDCNSIRCTKCLNWVHRCCSGVT